MKTHRLFRQYQLYGVILLAIVIFLLAKIKSVDFFRTLTNNSLLGVLPIILILYVASLPLSYGIQLDQLEVGRNTKTSVVMGFASGISMAALIVFYWVDFIINNRLLG